MARSLGLVTRGSLKDGLTLKLDDGVSVEALRAGKFVVVEGEAQRFFSMITDVSLGATDPRVLAQPPADGLLRQALSGIGIYGEASLRPLLMLERGTSGDDSLRPVKTIPTHFRPAFEATEDDVAAIFGAESADPNAADAGRYFHLGEPLDMATPVCLNLDRFVERSSGIFGKSGTGKTFLTRICLCGILRAQKAACLIFDMHSEYGWEGTFEGSGGSVRGLKQYFPAHVEVFALDPDSARRRGKQPDFQVRIPYSQLEPEDILLLAGDLNLTPTAAENAYLLHAAFRESWLETLLKFDSDSLKEFADRQGANPASLSALQRRLRYLANACESFLKPTLPAADDAVAAILRRLDQGISVVLEFGTESRTLAYTLVANLLTRRLHREYVKKKEAALGNQGKEPQPLVIVIEEAHKFLAPGVVGQTIFGTIARELRKYNVTLLLVDQRPSGIASEVLSQIGTRVTCLLNDEADIDAVLTGVSGARELRGVLASLDSKQQALVLGHAVPMPVVIKTRTYDDAEFRTSMQAFRDARGGFGALEGEVRARRLSLDFD